MAVSRMRRNARQTRPGTDAMVGGVRHQNATILT